MRPEVGEACASAGAMMLVAALLGASCDVKVPLVDVGAAFTVADATWFEDEETLFVFYRIDAQQGLSSHSQVEIGWATDEAVQGFAALQTFTPVHTHVPVSCGFHTMCGSISVHVPLQPRYVEMRLRYHEDGDLTLDAPVAFHVEHSGPSYTQRSAIVYGVFTEDNTRVQWRLRHHFPALRNTEVQKLGLRRELRVLEPSFGTLDTDIVTSFKDSRYGYAIVPACPATFTALGWPAQVATDRAMFDPHELPLEASTSAVVCAQARVIDGRGTFTAVAVARKNPEVAPAFPALHTPVTENVPLRFMLETCDDISSQLHLDMQRQRLFMSDADVLCIDDFAAPNFTDDLARTFQDRIDVERLGGDDMILLIGLQRTDDSGVVPTLVEDALVQVVTVEGDKSSPRMTGAFVFDSAGYRMRHAAVARVTLWCPSSFGGGDLDQIDDVSLRDCAVQQDQDLQLGPVRITTLPILPTRKQYLNFVDRYSVGLAGRMRNVTFRAPTRTPVSDTVPIEGFGEVTFFNEEAISAEPTDAFSFCGAADVPPVVVRTEIGGTLMALAGLPDQHNEDPHARYELGLAWDAPYYVHLEYETFLAGAATVAGFTIPFGPGSPSDAILGGGQWQQEEFVIGDALLRCSRFCDHPTFDSSGVYNVRKGFRKTFADACYTPKFPRPGDGGFPRDP